MNFYPGSPATIFNGYVKVFYRGPFTKMNSLIISLLVGGGYPEGIYINNIHIYVCRVHI